MCDLTFSVVSEIISNSKLSKNPITKSRVLITFRRMIVLKSCSRMNNACKQKLLDESKLWIHSVKLLRDKYIKMKLMIPFYEIKVDFLVTSLPISSKWDCRGVAQVFKCKNLLRETLFLNL